MENQEKQLRSGRTWRKHPGTAALAVLHEENGEITQAIEVWNQYLTQAEEGTTPARSYHFGLLIAADTPPKALPYLDQAS